VFFFFFFFFSFGKIIILCDKFSFFEEKPTIIKKTKKTKKKSKHLKNEKHYRNDRIQETNPLQINLQ